MFYMFHHMPKCGGTSFREFLNSVFDVRKDYIGGGGRKKNPARYERYVAEGGPALDSLCERDCLSGHFNLPGSFLWERFPDLEQHDHRKFSILRDPFETARSGVYFGIKRGKLGADLGPDEIRAAILKRNNHFSRTLGIRSEDEIDQVLDRYWFVAPLDRVEEAAAAIEAAVGRKGASVGHTNVTEKPEDAADFRARAALDYALYDRACARFDTFMKTVVPV